MYEARSWTQWSLWIPCNVGYFMILWRRNRPKVIITLVNCKSYTVKVISHDKNILINAYCWYDNCFLMTISCSAYARTSPCMDILACEHLYQQQRGHISLDAHACVISGAAELTPWMSCSGKQCCGNVYSQKLYWKLLKTKAYNYRVIRINALCLWQVS